MIFSQETLTERKARAAEALDRVIGTDEVVLVHAGSPVQKPGGHDQTYHFHPHPDYFWLTAIRKPAGVSAYSKADGWIDFVQPITRDDKIWEGGGEAYPGRELASFESWYKAQNFKRTFHLGQKTESLSLNPASDSVGVLEAYNEVRRVKDAAEVSLIRSLAVMAQAGYSHLKSVIKPGITERQIQIAYETAVFNAGSERMPYDSIVGTGTNSAILHAIPTKRAVQDGDIVLVDAGADVEDYCVDITRVFAAGKKFSSQQQLVYDTVLRAQTDSITLCKPATAWSEVHLAAARAIASGLREAKIITCSVDEALETGAVSTFFPHGVGHMVGLRVRDAGGRHNPTPKKYAGARLRVDMDLRAGYIMTVEPGLYFIQALLRDQDTIHSYKHQINFSEVEKWIDVGGVRLEDDIHVTASGPENLTAIIEK